MLKPMLLFNSVMQLHRDVDPKAQTHASKEIFPLFSQLLYTFSLSLSLLPFFLSPLYLQHFSSTEVHDNFLSFALAFELIEKINYHCTFLSSLYVLEIFPCNSSCILLKKYTPWFSQSLNNRTTLSSCPTRDLVSYGFINVDLWMIRGLF